MNVELAAAPAGSRASRKPIRFGVTAYPGGAAVDGLLDYRPLWEQV